MSKWGVIIITNWDKLFERTQQTEGPRRSAQMRMSDVLQHCVVEPEPDATDFRDSQVQVYPVKPLTKKNYAAPRQSFRTTMRSVNRNR